MEARSTGVGDAKTAPPTAHDSRAGDAVQASADLKDRVLAWARGAQLWWTASEAAKAIGAEENAVRSALEELEAEGLVCRLVNVRVWFDDGGTMRPGKGIAMRVETFGAFARAVAEAEAKLSGSFA